MATRRTPSATPRPAGSPDVARSGHPSEPSGDDPGTTSHGDATLTLSQVGQQSNEIAAAASTLRRRLVMGRYAGFAAGFDAGLAVCALLDTIARDRTRDMRAQRLRVDALALARHVNADVTAEVDAIAGTGLTRDGTLGER